MSDADEKVVLQSSTSDEITTPEIAVIHWTETLNWAGNHFGYPPETGMLIPGGLKKLRFKTLRYRTGEKVPFNVIYDESYVVQWLIKNLLRHFPTLPYNELQKLLSKAMSELRARENNGMGKAQKVRGRDI